MALNIKRLKLIDKAFLITLLLILSLGLVIQSSASLGLVSDASYYVKKQLLMIGVGLLGAFFIIRYDTSELKSFGPLLYLLSLGLLIAVLLFGTEVRGTTGWISLGPLPAIQPAEFTKIMLIVAFADFINRRRGELDTLSQILPCLAYMGIPFI
jgi:rod shape determining protein RodA